MKQHRFFPLICALALAVGLLIPCAAAAQGPELAVSGSSQAARQTVGLTGLPGDCQSLQITLTLSAQGGYTFTADPALADRSDVYATYKQSGREVTVYLTARTDALTAGGSLTLGVLTSDGGPFTVEGASGLKVLGADSAELTYPTVDIDQGSGSEDAQEPETPAPPAGNEGGSGGSSGGDGGSGPQELPFADVAPGSWYYEGVGYAYAHGLMSGTGEGTFSPDLPTSRGMLVTILYRLAGSPAVDGAAFTDVVRGAWYADGVAWASANGVVSGYPDGSFRPNDTITREQMAAILYQYARLQGKLEDGRADLSVFADENVLSAYAREPMSWAVAQGLFSGVSADLLAPGGSTTRAQAAVILTAFSRALA